MRMQRAFRRRLESLSEIVRFTADALTAEVMDAKQRNSVDLAIEELFTNMIKYSRPGSAEVLIEIAAAGGAVMVTLTDTDVEPFDVTLAPAANVDAPPEQREPGGLGLHLVRRLVDSLSYEYVSESRESRTSFRVTCSRSPTAGNNRGGVTHADD